MISNDQSEDTFTSGNCVGWLCQGYVNIIAGCFCQDGEIER